MRGAARSTKMLAGMRVACFVGVDGVVGGEWGVRDRVRKLPLTIDAFGHIHTVV